MKHSLFGRTVLTPDSSGVPLFTPSSAPSQPHSRPAPAPAPLAPLSTSPLSASALPTSPLSVHHLAGHLRADSVGSAASPTLKREFSDDDRHPDYYGHDGDRHLQQKRRPLDNGVQPQPASSNPSPSRERSTASPCEPHSKKQKRNKPTLSCFECVERKTKVRLADSSLIGYKKK